MTKRKKCPPPPWAKKPPWRGKSEDKLTMAERHAVSILEMGLGKPFTSCAWAALRCKPCPFCGWSVEILLQEYGFLVKCYMCGGQKPVFSDTVLSCISAWNRRSDATEPVR